MGITYSSFTNKGERPINEDCVDIIRTQMGVCLVLCDGLGGHDSGEVASKCVCDSIRRGFENAKKGAKPEELLKTLMDNAQTELRALQEELNKSNDMRTTACCVIISGKKCTPAYVGDSRIYHFVNSRAVERSQDHSIPQFLVNVGEISEKDIRKHPDRNKLIRVMGSPWDNPQYQTPDFSPMREGDAYLLCSDGFWEWIEETDMEKYLQRSASPGEWIERMKQHVLRNGKGQGMDNFSAVAAFYGTPAKPKKTLSEKIGALFGAKGEE